MLFIFGSNGQKITDKKREKKEKRKEKKGMKLGFWRCIWEPPNRPLISCCFGEEDLSFPFRNFHFILLWIFRFPLQIMGKGPGLYSDIGKRARGFSFLHLHFFFPIVIWRWIFYFRWFFLKSFGILLFFLPDLLYKDYQSDHKFTITTYSPTGVVSFLLSVSLVSRSVGSYFHCWI